MPRVPMVMTMSSTVRVMDTSDVMNVESVASVLRFANTFPSQILTLLMSHAPMTYMAIAARSLRPKSIALCSKSCMNVSGSSLTCWMRLLVAAFIESFTLITTLGSTVVVCKNVIRIYIFMWCKNNVFSVQMVNFGVI